VGRHFGTSLPLPAGKGPEPKKAASGQREIPMSITGKGEGKSTDRRGEAAGAPARDWLRPQIAAEGQDSVSYFSSSIVTATAPMADSRTLLPATSATRLLSMK
jgi:hypothetical protein